MNKDEFIQEVELRFSKTEDDNLLIQVMMEILDYFKSISSEINNIDGKLSVGFNHDAADFLEVTLFENHLHFSRKEDNISVSFVSSKDNQFTKQYEHLNLDTFIVVNDLVVSSKDKSPFDVNNLESYLKYLLA